LRHTLTMLVRGFYYLGWKPESMPKKMHRKQFLDTVQKQLPYSTDGGAERLMNGVLRTLGG
jgi:hypothetical protein